MRSEFKYFYKNSGLFDRGSEVELLEKSTYLPNEFGYFRGVKDGEIVEEIAFFGEFELVEVPCPVQK